MVEGWKSIEEEEERKKIELICEIWEMNWEIKSWCVKGEKIERKKREVKEKCWGIIDGRRNEVGRKIEWVKDNGVERKRIKEIGMVWSIGGEVKEKDRVKRKDDGEFGGLGIGNDLEWGRGKIMIEERFEEIKKIGWKESVGNEEEDEKRIEILDKVGKEVEIGRKIWKEEDGEKREGRIEEEILKWLKIRMNGEEREGRKEMGKKLSRGMGEVRGGKGIVKIEIEIGGKRMKELRIVILIEIVEKGILKKKEVEVIKRIEGRFRIVEDEVLGKMKNVIKKIGERIKEMIKRILIRGKKIREKEMGEKDEIREINWKLRDGRKDELDEGKVGELEVWNRKVEVKKEKKEIGLEIGIVKGEENNVYYIGNYKEMKKNRKWRRGVEVIR